MIQNCISFKFNPSRQKKVMILLSNHTSKPVVTIQSSHTSLNNGYHHSCDYLNVESFTCFWHITSRYLSSHHSIQRNDRSGLTRMTIPNYFKLAFRLKKKSWEKSFWLSCKPTSLKSFWKISISLQKKQQQPHSTDRSFCAVRSLIACKGRCISACFSWSRCKVWLSSLLMWLVPL